MTLLRDLTETELGHRDTVITTLLEWYQDVVESWQDDRAAGDHGYPMMNSAWNHPSYRELEQHRQAMRRYHPRKHWHLAERYIRSGQKRVMQCPKCERTWPYKDSLGFHQHGNKHITLIPASITIIPTNVDPRIVQTAIRWISQRFTREPFLPEIDGHLLGDGRDRQTETAA